MSIKKIILVFGVVYATPALAEPAMNHDHGGANYHAFRLETDFGQFKGENIASWDLDGWYGNDYDKLWLKSEGEIAGSKTEQAEIWALYSRNIATFWDAQIGLRQDFKPQSHSYLAAGFNGLAPYFFETQAHLFVRDDGAISARLRQENDLLITNRLIVQPYAEANFNGEADRTLGLGSGLSDGNIGLQTRYEFSREFAPYLDIKYASKFGQTKDWAKLNGEKAQATTFNIGIRLKF
ncbi:MAG: copper resistance protein B [Proteobacteria bacterium]|nr:copper resistance protein B [Pseudomonadota bacterium]